MDVETEQLISEIEMLTSRALQETHQWTVPGTGSQQPGTGNTGNEGTTAPEQKTSGLTGRTGAKDENTANNNGQHRWTLAH